LLLFQVTKTNVPQSLINMRYEDNPMPIHEDAIHAHAT